MSWSPEFDRDIRYSSTSFCQERLRPTDGYVGGEHDSLLGFINAWLRADEGTRWTGGDYTAYLQAVLIIIDEYDKDPSILNYREAVPHDENDHPPKERRVQRILDLDDWGASCLDPHVYHKVFRGEYD